jgi:hypothetical protein
MIAIKSAPARHVKGHNNGIANRFLGKDRMERMRVVVPPVVRNNLTLKGGPIFRRGG